MTDDEIVAIMRERLSEAVREYRDAVVKYAEAGVDSIDSDVSKLESSRRRVVEIGAACSFLALARFSLDGPVLLAGWYGGGGGFGGGGASGGW